MSLRFGAAGAVTGHVVQSSGLATAPSFPVTMSIWFYSNKTTGREPLFEFRASDPVTGDYFALDLTMLLNTTTTSRRVEAATYDPTNGILRAQTAIGAGNGWSTSTWNHAAGVFTSSLRTAYLNGGSSGTNSTTVTAPAGLTDPLININQCVTVVGVPTGHDASNEEVRLAEAAIWNTELTTAEITSLSKGFSPRLVQPNYLFFYAPLIRTASSSIFETTGVSMTAYNFAVPYTPTTEPHPRRIG